MAELRPFCGVHYNQSQVADLAAVICPPYDVISAQMQQELYQRSSNNFIRIEYGRELPPDTDTDNKYTRSAATLEQWLEQGILQIDETPAIYIHDHYFTYQGKEYRRRGLFVLVRLEEWNQMVVRPHEGTLTKPKGDRLNMLWALKANTSPILALFADKSRHITSLLTAQEQAKPVLSIRNADGEGHDVRAVTDTEVIGQICGHLADQPLYIADGHHRYESALAYLHEKRASSSSVTGNEPFNFVMMTLVDFADPGLVILPAHRLVYGMSKSTLAELMPKLKTFFELEELPLSASGAWQQVADSLAGETDGVRFFALLKDRLFSLELHDFTATSRMMPYFHSELYKRLDISLVDHVILEELLGLTADREEACLAFSHDMMDAVSKVLDQEYQLAFLLSPVRIEVIQAIADASDRMPRKSTHFYPKAPAGLVFHRLV